MEKQKKNKLVIIFIICIIIFLLAGILYITLNKNNDIPSNVIDEDTNDMIDNQDKNDDSGSVVVKEDDNDKNKKVKEDVKKEASLNEDENDTDDDSGSGGYQPKPKIDFESAVLGDDEYSLLSDSGVYLNDDSIEVERMLYELEIMAEYSELPEVSIDD